MKELSKVFPVWFCDIWGVVHNGHAPFTATTDVLRLHRSHGGRVVLVTNSPRTASGVEAQLGEVGVDRASWDDVVTSGDVTRVLMVETHGGQLYHIGPARDLSLFAGLDIARVPLAAANAIIATGLFHEESEVAADYAPSFRGMIERGLPMICANPDKVVRKGKRILPCAGALAEVYAGLGGVVHMAGKPFAPIYDLAMRKAGADKSQVLAIGDGPETDVKGAADYGLPVVLISGGVNDVAHGLEDDVKRLVPHAKILAVMDVLRW
jgi:HAD superfamily hydrolase (TIGR01459 family)